MSERLIQNHGMDSIEAAITTYKNALDEYASNPSEETAAAAYSVYLEADGIYPEGDLDGYSFDHALVEEFEEEASYDPETGEVTDGQYASLHFQISAEMEASEGEDGWNQDKYDLYIGDQDNE